MGGASGRWLSPDGAAFTNGIRALKKETLESSGLGPSAVGVICAPGSGPFPDAESVDTLVLDIPVSRTVRNKYLCSSQTVYDILLQKPGQLRHQVSISRQMASFIL